VGVKESQRGIQIPIYGDFAIQVRGLPTKLVRLIMKELVIPSVSKLFPHNSHQGTVVQLCDLEGSRAWRISSAGKGNINGNRSFFPSSILILPFVPISFIVLICTQLTVDLLPMRRRHVGSVKSIVAQNLQQFSIVTL
jgi:hypothetical protein